MASSSSLGGGDGDGGGGGGGGDVVSRERASETTRVAGTRTGERGRKRKEEGRYIGAAREQGRKKGISVIGASERDTSREQGDREETRSSGRTRKEKRSYPAGASEREAAKPTDREEKRRRKRDGTYRSGWISGEGSEMLRCDGERWNAAGR